MGAVSHKAWCAVTRYRTIYADPPWPERGGGKSKRGADRHYNVMTVKQIKALPVGDLADPAGCVLWLWATGNYLADAIDCAREWGFRVVNFRPWSCAPRKSRGSRSRSARCRTASPSSRHASR